MIVLMMKMFGFCAFQLKKDPDICHPLPGLEQKQSKCEGISPHLGAEMDKDLFSSSSQRPFPPLAV